MDNLINELQNDYSLSESEALVVLGILGISTLDDVQSFQEAINKVDNELKDIAKKIAMA